MKLLQEKLNFLLDKYSVDEKITIDDKKTATINGEKAPLFSHRNERRFIELRNIANNGTLKNISVMRVARIITKGSDIFEALYREFDICRFVLNDEFKQVTAMKNGNVMNIIATTNKGIVCTIEISATLKDGIKPIDKHEIIAEHGIACDVVVDAQLKQDSIYLYGEEEKKFTDVDFELYGLEIEDIAVVRAAFSLAQTKNVDERKASAKVLETLVKAAETSVEKCERVVL